MASGPIKVDGLNDLLRAFGAADKALRSDLKDALLEAAQPVKRDAEMLARTAIPRNTKAWSRMRVGAAGHLVYVAPENHGLRGRGNRRLSRPRFADLLRDRAMEPARERNVHNVERRLDHMLGEVKAVWERYG